MSGDVQAYYDPEATIDYDDYSGTWTWYCSCGAEQGHLVRHQEAEDDYQSHVDDECPLVWVG